MESHGEPDAAGAADGQAENHSYDYDLQNSEWVFVGVAEMRGAEEQRKNQRGNPEAHAAGVDEEQVAAENKFFADGHEIKSQPPADRVFKNIRAG